MELSATYGIINLAITLAIYTGFLFCFVFMLSKRTMLLGVFSILSLFLLAHTWTIVLYYYKLHQNHVDAEGLLSLLLAPIIAIILTVTYLLQFKKEDKAKLIDAEYKHNLVRAFGLLFATTIVYSLVSWVLNLPNNLLLTVTIAILVALLWTSRQARS